MACFWVNAQGTTVKIPTTLEKEGVTLYEIKISVGDIFWIVTHRYNDFFELHTKLVNDHGVAKDILPSKKLIRSKCPQFIDTRRKGLELYLQKLLKFLKLTMPRIFLEFLNFHVYDVYFLLQSLALKFYSGAESYISTTNSYNFTTLEIHAISKCCNTPQPAEYNPDKRYDFTHVLDFCSQLKDLNVTGIIGNYLRSNIQPNDLLFDFRNFKKITNLSLKEICLDCIKDLGQLRNNLETMTINKSNMTSLSQILQCDVLHKYNFDSTHVWSNLVKMDLSHNCLTEIDQTIKLVPNLKTLILDQNRFSNIPNLLELKNLTTLSICGNLITSCKQIHFTLGNISHLNLSQNSITSLEGFTKLYSLETLNLTGNNINNIEEIKFLSNLPCLEDLKLTGNSVSTIVDYRVKVLEYFGKRAQEICLDNEQPLQPELDKVSIRRALKILKDGEVPEILSTR
ncbi:nischarin [Coccinella septempunctata]|uniref:nischarin n=1 Tax=Coccinella septempunctata TaxID=41139 RepID=UPI001D09612A|nr:nischarin [Coccinella septempunctata]